MSEIELSYVTIRYQEPVVYYYYKDGAELGFPEIRELVFYAETLSRGRPYVTVAIVTGEINVTAEGKRYLGNPEHMPLFRGTAALVKNSIYSFAVNFMQQFNRNTFPFRAFTKLEKAEEWLRSLPLS